MSARKNHSCLIVHVAGHQKRGWRRDRLLDGTPAGECWSEENHILGPRCKHRPLPFRRDPYFAVPPFYQQHCSSLLSLRVAAAAAEKERIIPLL